MTKRLHAVKRIGRSASKRPPSGTKGPHPKKGPRRTRASHIYRDFFVGLLLATILIGFKWIIEGWEFGKQLEQMTYNMLQIRLLALSGVNALPVTIVDISGLPPEAAEHNGSTEMVTPRAPLIRIMKAIVSQNPRAVGIDLNFSSSDNSYLTPADPAFFEFCLDVRHRGIPVYVGIYDSIVFGPKSWLVQPDFQPLAAYISVPNPEHTEPSTRMIEWVRPAGTSEPCFSLPYALARTEDRPIISPIRWAVKQTTIRQEEEFSASEFLVDYGPLEKLMAQRLIATDAAGVTNQSRRIAGKIILIGRATPSQSADQFNVPGRGMPVPGVYLHAAATCTLLQAPLFRLTASGRVVADFLASVLVFGPILLMRRYRFKSRPRGDDVHRLYLILTALVILVVFFIGHLLVHRIRLIWTDYLMVIGALLLHSPSERVVTVSSRWLSERTGPRWKSLVMEEGKGRDGSKNENVT